MSVVEAVQLELEKLPDDASQSALAATAMALAAELDARNSATSKSMCARAMVDVLRELRELTPPEKEDDALDDLAARRQRRLAGGAAAAHPARS